MQSPRPPWPSHMRRDRIRKVIKWNRKRENKKKDNEPRGEVQVGVECGIKVPTRECGFEDE